VTDPPAWADETFPGSSLQSKIAHAHKELEEILTSNGSGQAVEFADVFMILCHAASS
jgi:hypothetical protein